MIQYLSNLHFASPWWFLGLLIIPLMIWWQYFSSKSKETTVTLSDISGLDGIISWKEKVYPWLPLLTIGAILMFIIAMARPQLSLSEEKVKADGIDIMLVMDLSSSMLSKDFDPDRLEVSKMVAKEFVEKRVHDRIGLVVFAGEAFTQCPLTTDHNIVTDFLSGLQVGMLEDGTAIGMGLATAVNRLKDSKAKSKIIILLTDGVNNAGYINPNTAAEIAKKYDVKVYTIAVGTMGQALSPVNRRSDGQYMFAMASVEIDTELLKHISQMTDAKYFRAVDRASLEDIYAEIDRLEKTEIEVNVYKRYKDEYRLFLLIGFGLVMMSWVLSKTIFRTLS
ncbi:MAG: VWA domain-containing protein [Saprospiraceae bacterium]|jgi:Ca-activated chloride channel family protein|nr:VWA domain-containing protein [Saprospiraceae bacterium]